MRFKPGVLFSVGGLEGNTVTPIPVVWKAMRLCDFICQGYGYDLYVTSLIRKKTRKFSFHSTGHAFDIRTRKMGADAWDITKELREHLESGFQVIYGDPKHRDHIHVEFDPKGV